MPDILVVTTSYPTPESPAAGAFVREYVRATAPTHRSVVLHLERTTQTHRLRVERAHDEAPVVRVRFPEKPTGLSYVALLAASAVGYRAVRSDGFRPDVIHAHFLTGAVPAVILGRLLGVPVVVSEHWSIFLPEDPATLSPVLARAARLAFKRATIVLPVSNALARGLAAHGIDARMTVVPNAVDTDAFHSPARRPIGDPARILTVGLFYEAKGIDLLLEAAARLQEDEGTSVRFVIDIVGDGALRREYEALADRLGIADIVTFHGLRTKPEIAQLMREADLYVLPSRFDNNPVAVLEALVSGLPVVATAVGGVPELIEDPSMLSAPDPRALAAAIAQALDTLSTFDRNAIAKRAAERYGMHVVGSTLARIYREALARP